jgi:hypothetical protein
MDDKFNTNIFVIRFEKEKESRFKDEFKEIMSFLKTKCVSIRLNNKFILGKIYLMSLI